MKVQRFGRDAGASSFNSGGIPTHRIHPTLLVLFQPAKPPKSSLGQVGLIFAPFWSSLAGSLDGFTNNLARMGDSSARTLGESRNLCQSAAHSVTNSVLSPSTENEYSCDPFRFYLIRTRKSDINQGSIILQCKLSVACAATFV